jgi:hypothetical protein
LKAAGRGFALAPPCASAAGAITAARAGGAAAPEGGSCGPYSG